MNNCLNNYGARDAQLETNSQFKQKN